MTEFEKWWKKMLCSNNKNLELMAKFSWIAALKWVYNELRNDANGFFNIGKELESLAQSNNQGDNGSQSNSPS